MGTAIVEVYDHHGLVVWLEARRLSDTNNFISDNADHLSVVSSVMNYFRFEKLVPKLSG